MTGGSAFGRIEQDGTPGGGAERTDVHLATRKPSKSETVLDAPTLNLRLLAGHHLVTTTDENGRVVSCQVLYFDDVVPVPLFNSYLTSGMLIALKEPGHYGLSPDGKKRIK